MSSFESSSFVKLMTLITAAQKELEETCRPPQIPRHSFTYSGYRGACYRNSASVEITRPTMPYAMASSALIQ